MRFGYWTPIFGGWLRNVEDEGISVDFGYTAELARFAEANGFDVTLVSELNLNDIKGIAAPSLEAWTVATALAAVTERIEIMTAIRPGRRPRSSRNWSETLDGRLVTCYLNTNYNPDVEAIAPKSGPGEIARFLVALLPVREAVPAA